MRPAIIDVFIYLDGMGQKIIELAAELSLRSGLFKVADFYVGVLNLKVKKTILLGSAYVW